MPQSPAIRPDSQIRQWVVDPAPCALPAAPVLEAPSPRRRLQIGRAIRSVRALIAHPDSTAHALDVEHAAGHRAFERAFQRFARDPEGRRLLAARCTLADALSNRDALEALPEGSFGRAYLDYMDANGFEPLALVDLERSVAQRWAEEGVPPLDPARLRFRERALLAHDLHHVLTDYGTDGIGEATLLAFDLAQQGGLVPWMLNLGASLEVVSRVGPRWLPYVLRAWKRGRRARPLITLPFEDLLPLPLCEVRAIAGVEPAGTAHPEGIWRSVVPASA